jgi:hypothetical protein
MSPRVIAINCTHLVTEGGRTAAISQVGNSSVAVTFMVSSYATEVPSSWLLLTPSAVDTSFTFDSKTKYSLALTYLAPDPSDTTKMIATSEAPTTLDLGGSVTITASKISSQPEHFIFSSHVGFADSTGTLIVQDTPGDLNLRQTCLLFLENSAQKHIPITGRCYAFSPKAPATSAGFLQIDPQLVGQFDIHLKGFALLQSSLTPMGLPTGDGLPMNNVLQVAPKIDPTSRISPQKAPATKDATSYYFNINYAAGTGTAPGWQLDGKVAPVLKTIKGYTIGPSATANVGGNKVPGQTYTDSINLGGTVQRMFQPGYYLPILSGSVSAIYETDKKFDRDNVLGTTDFKFNFRHLFNTQSIQTLRNYYTKVKTLSPTAPKPLLSDEPVPLFGYAFDFHAGLQGGRAIRDTTVKATSGNASLVLPAYTIFRIVPQVHAILQLWKISTDTTVVGRYLTATENTVLQTKSNALHLEHLQTWRALCTSSATYSESSSSHIGLTIKYTNGFDAPTYARVNSVQAGLLVKY